MKSDDLVIGKCYDIKYRRAVPVNSWSYGHETLLNGVGYLVEIDDPLPGWHTFRLKSSTKIVYSSSRGVIGELFSGAIFVVPGPPMMGGSWQETSLQEKDMSLQERASEAGSMVTFLDGLGVSCSVDGDAITIPYESLVRFKMVIATLYKKVLLEDDDEEE
jgi:hypothetical protein